VVVENLIRVEWEELLKSLLSVPITERTRAWGKAVAWIQAIISGTNELAVRVAPDNIHYAVPCSICKRTIHLADDFVFHPLQGVYNHFDCSYRSGLGNDLDDSGGGGRPS